MKQSELLAEINDLIDEMLRENGTASANTVRRRMMDRHSDLHGDASDCALLCMWEHFTDTVRAALRPREPDDGGGTQSEFPGFTRIQRAYHIERSGEVMLVKTRQLTPFELRAKAKEHRLLGAGNFAHADELDRLADEFEAGAP